MVMVGGSNPPPHFTKSKIPMPHAIIIAAVVILALIAIGLLVGVAAVIAGGFKD